ncbi:2-hydroxy-3-oxopropionate reductase [Eubacteriales bacterium OttesenSCG-928-A19]|nr:2-hydroxy-3-oxopropionate reductase [Eubacteriales bacterium OttesenSCG-928-A19]
MKVGFVGLGVMGKHMARNLVKAGYDVTVYDINPEAVKLVAAGGAKAAPSIRDLAAQSDVLITMVPNSPQVKEVLLGEGGAIETLRTGSVVIDTSSINPMASREVAAALAEKGVEMLDAPVSGGEPKAEDGTLAFMVGGKQEVFDAHKELLSKMGASVVRCGDIGAGNVTKLCNQIVVAVNIAAVSEALTLGQMAGVAPEAIFEAIKGGLAGSTVMNAKAPMMMDRNFKPGFRIDLHIKDLNNVLDAAKSVDAPVPLTAQIMEMMKNLHKDGEGSSDHSALVKFYEKLSGEEIHH